MVKDINWTNFTKRLEERLVKFFQKMFIIGIHFIGSKKLIQTNRELDYIN